MKILTNVVKRCILFIFLCMLVMSSACQQATPGIPNDGDTITANDFDGQETTGLSEQEGQMDGTTEQSTEYILETEPSVGGDVPSLVIESESEYEEFIVQCTELPEGFVQYDDIAAFGEYRSLTFSVLGDYGYYLYTLTDSAGFNVLIVVNHTPAQNTDREILTFEANASDLRLCASDSQGLVIYQMGELYYYYGSGELMWISWMQDGVEISVKGGFESKLSAYPQNAEQTAMSGLLSLDTAESTHHGLFHH